MALYGPQPNVFRGATHDIALLVAAQGGTAVHNAALYGTCRRMVESLHAGLESRAGLPPPSSGRHGDGSEGPARSDQKYGPERAGCLLPHSRGHRQACLASSLRTAFSAWSRVARSPKSQSLPSSPSAAAIVRPSSYSSTTRGSM